MGRNQFRVGTFNLCNLALPDKEFYGHEVYTQEAYKQKLAWTGLNSTA
jgi:hypothetical protein